MFLFIIKSSVTLKSANRQFREVKWYCCKIKYKCLNRHFIKNLKTLVPILDLFIKIHDVLKIKLA